MPTPSVFSNGVTTPTIAVKPLVPAGVTARSVGWCTYGYDDPTPDMEVMCGGVNEKTEKAWGVWRQGHLVHFGFDVLPDRMTEFGKRLLLNCIAYAFRFSEDRPIPVTVSPFVATRRLGRRSTVEQFLKRPKLDPERLEELLASDLMAQVREVVAAERVAWWTLKRSRIRPAEKGPLLELDADLVALDADHDNLDAMLSVARALDIADRGVAAHRVLSRYLPEGPVASTEAETWIAWLQAARPYLFFTELGGYRWYVDPLAQKRKIPSAELRGSKRASRAVPPVKGS